MPMHKTAIAIPNELLGEVDHAARERGESRSRYITRVLRVATRARRDREITRRLDAFFAKGNARQEQARTASAWDEVGNDWTDERW
jgi:metal-responsive CopG/Arc/MetJ family transcriptional regulator